MDETDALISELMTSDLKKEPVFEALEKRLNIKLNAGLKNIVLERGRAFGYPW